MQQRNRGINRFLFTISGLICVSLMIFSLPIKADTDVEFSGALISEPCQIDSESEDMTVDFGPLAKKSFIDTNESVSKKFSVLLRECDPDIGSKVAVRFNASKDNADSDLFAVNGTVSGIALKITDSEGETVKPNAPQEAVELNKGDKELNWQASIIKTARDDIMTGDFYAIINLSLEYP
ncbi:fimbrial protein [Pantoea ananatis]|uniref:fimbrial protein n=1 Tax=Pantoea ananas TaxID=553 RepID=UPI000696B4E1|nr:fimbrial protein [Pantoea ananatis]